MMRIYSSFFLMAFLIGCASKQIERPVDTLLELTPASIRAPITQTIATKAFFEGGLIYTCTNQAGTKGLPPIYDWEETGSQGSLTFEGEQGYGQYEGQSYTWRLDRTTLQGVLVRAWMGNARTDAPWGLYKTVGAAGNNILAQVNWIQRVGTRGGAIPTIACNAQFMNIRHAVKASAYFIFWRDSD